VRLKALVRTGKETLLMENSSLVKLLAGIGELATDGAVARPAGSIGLAGNDFEAFVFIADAADTTLLRQKFTKELEKDMKYIEGLRAKLANEKFLQNAPAELVAGEKLKLEESLSRTGKPGSYIRDMT
jgi:valyl-tRNA synthetase